MKIILLNSTPGQESGTFICLKRLAGVLEWKLTGLLVTISTFFPLIFQLQLQHLCPVGVGLQPGWGTSGVRTCEHVFPLLPNDVRRRCTHGQKPLCSVSTIRPDLQDLQPTGGSCTDRLLHLRGNSCHTNRKKRTVRVQLVCVCGDDGFLTIRWTSCRETKHGSARTKVPKFRDCERLRDFYFSSDCRQMERQS